MPYCGRLIRCFYRAHGSPAPGQPAVVLLHGLGASGDDWPLQLPAFTRHHGVVTFDARGHGRSRDSGPLGPWSIGDMAGDAAELLEHLGGAPAHLVGLSLGGCLALQLAIDRPALVRSLVVVNAFARLRPAGPRGLLRFVRRLWLLNFAPMQATAEIVAHGLFPKPEQRVLYEITVARLAANPKETYRNSLRALARFNAAPHLGRVGCPTLVIAGDRDQTIPLAAKQRLARGIPGARLVVIPDSGHATPYDQAEMFNKLVLDFVGEIET